jgi:sensor domain CHASE-containing protein
MLIYYKISYDERRRLMGIRTKAFQLIGVTALVLVIILYIISQVIIGGSIKAQEITSTKQTIGRVEKIISNESSMLNTTVTDWSEYDPAYNFMKDHNKAYIDENLSDATFSSLNLNFMIYISKEGKVICKKGYDPAANKQVPVPKELLDYLKPGSVCLIIKMLILFMEVYFQ